MWVECTVQIPTAGIGKIEEIVQLLEISLLHSTGVQLPH